MILSAKPNAPADAPGIENVWEKTAAAPGQYPPLSGLHKADVAIVGAGYTGLSAALHLAESGVKVVLLEAREPGWGASGRSGGQVIPGLKYDPPEMLSKYGPDLGARMADFAGGAPQLVFDLIDRYGIECDARRCGWIQPAHSSTLEGMLKRRAESWAARGAAVELLDRARVSELLGSDAYLSGWLDRRGGALNPLGYSRGLARAAQAAGVTIHANTPVQSMRRDNGKFQLKCQGGTVEADQVVLATNGYTGSLVPTLKRTIIATHSFQVATDPLSDNVRKSILPQGHVSSDSRRVLLYFRFDCDGRFLIGGVGGAKEPGREAQFKHLVNAARQIFPQMTAPFTHHWYGRVALTRDFMPHLHELEPGLHTALGYNGRGIAMGTAMGKLLARRVTGEPASALPFPTSNMKPVPFHFLRNIYVGAVRSYYRLRDITV